METQRTANRHLLACDGPPGYLGHGHVAPGGGFFPSPGSLAFVSRVLAPVSSSRALVSVRSPGSACPGPLAHLSWPPLAACHSGAPGAWPWRSLSHSICFSLCQRSFSLFFFENVTLSPLRLSSEKLHSSITLEIPWSLPRALVFWCHCFPWTVLSLRRAIVSVCSRFARPVSCVSPWLVLSSFGSWRCSLPRWRLWKTWSRTICSPLLETPSGLIALIFCRGTCSVCRAFAASVPLALSFAQGRSAQPAWAHRAVGQELSCGPDRSVFSHRCSGSTALSSLGARPPWPSLRPVRASRRGC